MAFETLVYSSTNRFRVSPLPFDAQVANEEVVYQRNPIANINPLGTEVEALTLFILGDTHYHVADRKSYDRTAVLPTTKLSNLLRQCFFNQINWHKYHRPLLYNNALEQWPDIVGPNLSSGLVIPTSDVIVVHTGDMSDDSLNQKELSEALQVTQNTMRKISNKFEEYWGGNVRVLSTYLLGDHDVDFRGWKVSENLNQINWFYNQLGVDKVPAVYFQEIYTNNGKSKAVLMLDTNLLSKYWVHSIRKASLNNGDNLINVVESHIDVQNEIIEHASNFDEVVIIGHKPFEAFKVAEQMRGNATVISGHLHFPYNTGNIALPFLTPKNIKLCGLGAATRGVGGVEVKGRPRGYLLSLSTDGDYCIPV